MTKKSTLVAAVLGAVGIGVTGAAFADTMPVSSFCKPGFYAGVQAGRTDTFYNSNELLSEASANGVTVTQSPNGKTFSPANAPLLLQNVDDIGIGGRIFAGYQFTPYFAMEAGYTQFAKTEFSAERRYASFSETNYKALDKYNGDVTQHAVDVVGKLTMPLQGGLGLYAKAGLAYITADRYVNVQHTETSVSGNTHSVANFFGTTYTKTYQAVRPTYGAGVAYSIPNTNVDVDLSWTRIQGMSAIPNADLAAVGLVYHFA